jgi:hypothetical protein
VRITDEKVDELAVQVLDNLLAEHVVENNVDAVLYDTMPDWLKLTSEESRELRAAVLAKVNATLPRADVLPQLVGATAEEPSP